MNTALARKGREQPGLRCLYGTPTAACKQLKYFRAESAQSLVCRAHNHRRSDECRWYVIPSAEWPPYANPMFFSDWDPDREGFIRIGAMICRGLTIKIAKELKRPQAQALVMKRHWRWREVIAEDNSDMFVESAVTAASRLDAGKIQVQIGGRPVAPEIGGDPYDGRGKWDRLVFDLDKSGSMKLTKTHNGTDQEVIKSYEAIADIDELAESLRNDPSEWLWLEVLVFESLEPESQAKGKGKKGEPESRLITTNELYGSLLAPFENWLYE